MSPIKNVNTGLPFSKTFSANKFVFISGQTRSDQTTGELVTDSFEAEAHYVMKNVEFF
jgi:enamine deaminase RidA (YjgF/YER057c/UK114 family)